MVAVPVLEQDKMEEKEEKGEEEEEELAIWLDTLILNAGHKLKDNDNVDIDIDVDISALAAQAEEDAQVAVDSERKLASQFIHEINDIKNKSVISGNMNEIRSEFDADGQLLSSHVSSYIALSLSIMKDEEELRVLSLIRGAEAALQASLMPESSDLSVDESNSRLIEAASAASEALILLHRVNNNDKNNNKTVLLCHDIISKVKMAAKEKIRDALYSAGWPPAVTASKFVNSANKSKHVSDSISGAFAHLCVLTSTLGHIQYEKSYTSQDNVNFVSGSVQAFAEVMVESLRDALWIHFSSTAAAYNINCDDNKSRETGAKVILPTARVDKPEWLLTHCSRVMKQLIPSAVQSFAINKVCVNRVSGSANKENEVAASSHIVEAAQIVFFNSVRELLRLDFVPRLMKQCGENSSTHNSEEFVMVTRNNESNVELSSSENGNNYSSGAVSRDLILHFVDEAIDYDTRELSISSQNNYEGNDAGDVNALFVFCSQTASAKMPWRNIMAKHAILSVISEKEEWIHYWAWSEICDALEQLKDVLPFHCNCTNYEDDGNYSSDAGGYDDKNIIHRRAWSMEVASFSGQDDEYKTAWEVESTVCRVEIIDQIMLLFDVMMTRSAHLPDVLARCLFLSKVVNDFFVTIIVEKNIVELLLKASEGLSLSFGILSDKAMYNLCIMMRAITALECLKEKVEQLSDEPFCIEVSTALVGVENNDNNIDNIFDELIEKINLNIGNWLDLILNVIVQNYKQLVGQTSSYHADYQYYRQTAQRVAINMFQKLKKEIKNESENYSSENLNEDTTITKDEMDAEKDKHETHEIEVGNRDIDLHQDNIMHGEKGTTRDETRAFSKLQSSLLKLQQYLHPTIMNNLVEQLNTKLKLKDKNMFLSL